MKRKLFLSLGLILILCVSVLPVSAAENNTNENSHTYRLYNSYSGEHFYTNSLFERKALVINGWTDEGESWYSDTETSNKPVYRLYNSYSGDHHYTTDIGERDWLVSLGWNDEGIAFNCSSEEAYKTPIYRLYNPNVVGAGSHHYTPNIDERTYLSQIGWNYEGVAWYVDGTPKYTEIYKVLSSEDINGSIKGDTLAGLINNVLNISEESDYNAWIDDNGVIHYSDSSSTSVEVLETNKYMAVKEYNEELFSKVKSICDSSDNNHSYLISYIPEKCDSTLSRMYAEEYNKSLLGAAVELEMNYSEKADISIPVINNEITDIDKFIEIWNQMSEDSQGFIPIASSIEDITNYMDIFMSMSAAPKDKTHTYLITSIENI